MPALEVHFLDEVHECSDSLTFGRTAELVIDDANHYMHRVVGSFDRRADSWWLTNHGSSIRLRLTGADGLRADLPSGTTTALTAMSGTVSFEAGPATYELEFRLAGEVPPRSSLDRRLPPSPAVGTAPFGQSLTPREVDFMLEFARPALVGTGTAPSYADVAQKYGVSEKTVDNTLQNLRRKLKESGVRGVTTLDSLVEHLVSTGKLSIDQLDQRRG